MFPSTDVVPGALTVVVSSGKGGVGKTATATALAAALAARGVAVTVIDGDIDDPNVHLVTQASGDLVVSTEPLGLTLPTSVHGFDVVTPVAVTRRVKNAAVTMSDLFALAQLADPPQVVIVDMPPGWTRQHTDVCSTLPGLVVTVVAPTVPALADHTRHVRQWRQAWAGICQALRNQDRRRKLDLPAEPTIVSVETMARFVGVPEGGGDPVTVRQLDALPADQVARVADPLVSVPAAADVAATAKTPEVGRLADLVQQHLASLAA